LRTRSALRIWDRHATAEQLHGEAVEAAVRVSLATVYDTLHQFIEAGLLREVVVNSGHSYFDTNVSDRHPFFLEDTDRPLDIPGEYVEVSRPEAARGRRHPPHRRDHPRQPGPGSDRRLEVF
jgi:Fur family iron response transcriptional regulator